MDDLTDFLRSLVAKKLNAEPQRIRLDTDLVADLGADSLGIVEIMMALEDELGVTIADAEAESIRTFGDAVTLVATKRCETAVAE
jgi:acyl carrier protein